MKQINLKNEALALASDLGFAVFPLRARSKTPHAGSHGFKDATTDGAQIAAVFDAHPNSNLGIACGAASGNLGVIDIDTDAQHNLRHRAAFCNTKRTPPSVFLRVFALQQPCRGTPVALTLARGTQDKLQELALILGLRLFYSLACRAMQAAITLHPPVKRRFINANSTAHIAVRKPTPLHAHHGV